MTKQEEQRVFSGWIYIQRADDLPDCWVGHLLEYNIVSQGSSPSEALEMVREAANLAFLDDLNRGLDPEARREQAQPEDFAPWRAMLAKSTLTSVSVTQLNPAEYREFAVPAFFPFVKSAAAPATAQPAPLAA